mgnify:CR=1 FL=1
MTLLRYGPKGQEKPGLLDGEGRIRSLAGVVEDLAGPVLGPAGLARLREVDVAGLPVVEGAQRLGPCVSGIGKFVCIGLNYADHAAESGLKVPPEPVIFMKATSACTAASSASGSTASWASPRAAARRPSMRSAVRK